MGRIVVTEFVSLDGVMEDPGGAEGFKHAGWTFRFNRGDEGDQFKLDELKGAEAQLLGRVTYEAFAQAWPTMEDPVGFADRMNAMPKYVVSTTLRDEDATWNNSTVIRGDVVRRGHRTEGDGARGPAGCGQRDPGAVAARAPPGRRVPVDGLPDCPGTGKRLFGKVSEPPMMVLDNVETVGEGIVILTYRDGR